MFTVVFFYNICSYFYGYKSKGEMSCLVGMSLPKIHTLWDSHRGRILLHIIIITINDNVMSENSCIEIRLTFIYIYIVSLV